MPGEQALAKIATMNRRQLMRTLHRMRCNFKLDFTDEFLASVSLERLRHIALATSLHAVEVGGPGPRKKRL